MRRRIGLGGLLGGHARADQRGERAELIHVEVVLRLRATARDGDGLQRPSPARGQDRTGRDGTGRDGTGRDGTGQDRIG